MQARDFLRLVRDNPDLFPRSQLTQKSRLSRAAVYAILRSADNPRKRRCADPKLSSFEALVAGCGGQLAIVLPESCVADLSQRYAVSR